MSKTKTTDAAVAEEAANDQLDEAVRQSSMGRHLKAVEFEVLFPDGLNTQVDEIVGLEEFGDEDSDKEKKTVVAFAGVARPIVMNKTNTRRLLKGLGTKPSEDWPGKDVKLSTSEKSNGKLGFDITIPRGGK